MSDDKGMLTVSFSKRVQVAPYEHEEGSAELAMPASTLNIADAMGTACSMVRAAVFKQLNIALDPQPTTLPVKAEEAVEEAKEEAPAPTKRKRTRRTKAEMEAAKAEAAAEAAEEEATEEETPELIETKVDIPADDGEDYSDDQAFIAACKSSGATFPQMKAVLEAEAGVMAFGAVPEEKRAHIVAKLIETALT